MEPNGIAPDVVHSVEPRRLRMLLRATEAIRCQRLPADFREPNNVFGYAWGLRETNGKKKVLMELR